jgi:hypothetical protein
MKRAIFGAIIGILAATAAHAGPYTGGAARCPSLLGSEVYRCGVRGEDGSQFDDCFRFATPGVVSGKFEFVSDRLGNAVGCTCKPAGQSFTPTASFTCTSSHGVSFEARILRDGSIGKGTVANVNGGSFIFSCQRDPACAVSQ